MPREADAGADPPRQGPCAECGRSACAPGRGVFAGRIFCDACWEAWLERRRPEGDSDPGPALGAPRPATLEASLPPLICSEPAAWWKHFDYVEVGTSDWGTLTHYCADDKDPDASWLAAEIRTSLPCLSCARGLAVEAVAEYLEALPRLPMVTCVNAAMNEKSGEDVLYCVSPENVERFMGKYRASLGGDAGDQEGTVDVMWWAKSLSSLGRPHPDLVAMLRQVGREDLLEERHVHVLSWGDLCRQHGVGTADVAQPLGGGSPRGRAEGTGTRWRGRGQAFRSPPGDARGRADRVAEALRLRGSRFWDRAWEIPLLCRGAAGLRGHGLCHPAWPHGLLRYLPWVLPTGHPVRGELPDRRTGEWKWLMYLHNANPSGKKRMETVFEQIRPCFEI